MEHRPYPKIATRIDGAVPPGGAWVALEKVHGAQLVVATDGAVVRVGKRKAWLGEGEAFFGWQLLRAELAHAARAAHAALGLTGVLRLYGELFGGRYPHAQVRAAPGAQPVQTGIWYAPDVRFALFDALFETADDDPGTFLAHSELVDLADTLGALTAPLLGRGPRPELDALPVRYATRVPALLGLPPLADNLAEGLVLKPDARARPAERVVLKRKIAEFDEQRFDESAPFDPDARLDAPALTELASRMVNPPRIASARSKLGEVDAAALRDEVVLDVLVDLEGAFPRAMGELEPAAEESLRATVSALTERSIAAEK